MSQFNSLLLISLGHVTPFNASRCRHPGQHREPDHIASHCIRPRIAEVTDGLMPPADPKMGYDVRAIVTRVVDYGDFLEIQAGFAPNIVIDQRSGTARPL